ncbi:MAG TPA: hypothetical protein DEE98_00730 [Elusimicrobia bacterium]|nr:MAG: hypothetical protein A2278_03355 [Elusimicrobia bacterium RIFOXYA12_FULL_49_49]OGS10002.1 MAG: hypothetical protein A2204_01495 [Elusimicrobia bacterium RIFOXYA1_FULL_47_7]OGS11764.1 MAG: hypothetical protein A2386_07195 [Elusimicrobia bacterium RIFOXYB1_FULL_48_9]OGS15599.1 MAG: hypothetical protein A2251_03605 [Elusimicrobia bacterium RIFOXYA2_FULL_47_53]OGS26845.1 MAG: hypothetical protein A2339_07375 [Elusimicrobia bacterium RIFOXYB12_FULL_50_12]OGS30698.1 MAG: hypothetical protein
MPHFFVPPEKINQNKFVIEGSQARHLAIVRRIKKGSGLDIFDGTGKSFSAVVTSVSKDRVEGDVIKPLPAAEPKIKVHLYSAVPKGDRFDWLVEKASELGISSIVPLICGRSQLRDFSEAKVERWRRLSASASEQSRRGDIMKISGPSDFAVALKQIPENSASIIPWEGEDKGAIETVFSKIIKSDEVNIFIGPEGGFDPAEIELAVEHGVIPVTLGESVLRVETAAIVSAVLVLNFFGGYK